VSVSSPTALYVGSLAGSSHHRNIAMNLVGKILTVIILLFSIFFLAVSVTVFQTHRVWRDVAIANKGKIEDLQERVKSLQAEIQAGKDRLALEQAARRFALGSLQTKWETSESALQMREQEYQRLLNEAGDLTETVSTTSQTLEATLKQNESLRQSLRDAQLARDTVFDQVVVLTDTKNSLEGTSQILRERNDDLNNMYTLAKHWLDRVGIDMHAPVDGKPPSVEAQVVSVGAKDLLEISIGSDDGIKQGHTLEVFRGNSYLGRVVVRETWPDRAVVQVIPEFRRGIIKVGDRVATKLG
jgi:hypothetical protein